MGWVRHGECNRCGECCKSGDPYNGTEGVNPTFGPSVCPHLRVDADGKTHHCAAFNSNNQYWVSACSTWPYEPENIAPYPSCSFTFTWEDDA